MFAVRGRTNYTWEHLQSSQILCILNVWPACCCMLQSRKDKRMTKPLSLPPLLYPAFRDVTAAKAAAAVNTTPSDVIRKGEVMGKCWSALTVRRHPRLNSWQTWGVFIIDLQVARVCFLFYFFFFFTSLRVIFSFLSLISLHSHASLHDFSALLGGVMGREWRGGREVTAHDPTVRQPLWQEGSRGKALNRAIAQVGFNQLNG